MNDQRYGGEDEQGNLIPYDEMIRILKEAEVSQGTGRKSLEFTKRVTGGMYNIATSDTTIKVAQTVGTASYLVGKTAYAGLSGAVNLFWNYWFPSEDKQVQEAFEKLSREEREFVVKLIEEKNSRVTELILLLARKK